MATRRSDTKFGPAELNGGNEKIRNRPGPRWAPTGDPRIKKNIQEKIHHDNPPEVKIQSYRPVNFNGDNNKVQNAPQN